MIWVVKTMSTRMISQWEYVPVVDHEDNNNHVVVVVVDDDVVHQWLGY